jgi:hypothetical protein
MSLLEQLPQQFARASGPAGGHIWARLASDAEMVVVNRFGGMSADELTALHVHFRELREFGLACRSQGLSYPLDKGEELAQRVARDITCAHLAGL